RAGRRDPRRLRRLVLPERSQIAALRRAGRRPAVCVRRSLHLRWQLVPALRRLAHRDDDHVPVPRLGVRRHHRRRGPRSGDPTAQRVRSAGGRRQGSASGSDHIQRAATTRYRSPLPALTGWQGRPHGWPGSTKTVPGITRTTDTAARRARNWLRVASRSRGSGRLQGMTGTQQFEAIVSAHGRDSILDVAYRIIDSPVGPLLLAATEQGLVRVAYARQDHGAVLQALANKVSPRILHAPARLDLSARELEEYF